MRRILTLAAAGALMCGGTALAHDKDKDAKVESKSGGISIVINGDDVEVEKFGDVDLDGAFGNLPEGVREKVMKALEARKAGDDDSGDSPVQIRGIFIGPDGEKHEFGEGGGKFDRKKMFDKLPKEVRERMEKAMKEQGGRGIWGGPRWNFKKPADDDSDVDVDIDIKGVIIGPDGKKHEIDLGKPGKFDHKKMFEGMPKEIREKMEKAMKEHGGLPGGIWGGFGPGFAPGEGVQKIQGKAIIIGPDGKPQEIELGKGFDPKDMFKNMPKEAQDAIKKAMENGHGHAFPARPFGPRGWQRGGGSDTADLEKKIDELQKQIEELRKALEK